MYVSECYYINISQFFANLVCFLFNLCSCLHLYVIISIHILNIYYCPFWIIVSKMSEILIISIHRISSSPNDIVLFQSSAER